MIFRETLFWETEAIFGRFGNFPHILGVWGFVEIAKTPKFGFCSSKQSLPEIFQTQLFSTEPVVHLRVVQLSRNFGYEPKIRIYGHLIFYLLSFWPTVTVLAPRPCWKRAPLPPSSLSDGRRGTSGLHHLDCKQTVPFTFTDVERQYLSVLRRGKISP